MNDTSSSTGSTRRPFQFHRQASRLASSRTQEQCMKNQLASLQESLDSIAKGEPVYQRWSDYRRAFKWAGADNGAIGSTILEYPAIEAPLVRGRMLMVPTAQSAPRHVDDNDTVFLCVEGEVEFTIGSQTLLLEPLDLVSIPAGTAFSYVNLGLANALLCGIYARADGKSPAPAAPKSDSPAMHMKWEQYRRDFHWTLPLAEHWGYHRGSGPLIISEGLRGHTVRIPTAQTTPWHYAARDMLFMGIQHEVAFKAAGREFALGPLDFLIIPAGTPYAYVNYGLSECVFFSIGGKLPAGKKGTYFAADPGWPIRADARTLQVEIDAHGDARVIGEAALQR
jgi:quercetin dioxygenase-like cupin family protein